MLLLYYLGDTNLHFQNFAQKENLTKSFYAWVKNEYAIGLNISKQIVLVRWFLMIVTPIVVIVLLSRYRFWQGCTRDNFN